MNKINIKTNTTNDIHRFYFLVYSNSEHFIYFRLLCTLMCEKHLVNQFKVCCSQKMWYNYFYYI